MRKDNDILVAKMKLSRKIGDRHVSVDSPGGEVCVTYPPKLSRRRDTRGRKLPETVFLGDVAPDVAREKAAALRDKRLASMGGDACRPIARKARESAVRHLDADDLLDAAGAFDPGRNTPSAVWEVYAAHGSRTEKGRATVKRHFDSFVKYMEGRGISKISEVDFRLVCDYLRKKSKTRTPTETRAVVADLMSVWNVVFPIGTNPWKKAWAKIPPSSAKPKVEVAQAEGGLTTDCALDKVWEAYREMELARDHRPSDKTLANVLGIFKALKRHGASTVGDVSRSFAVKFYRAIREGNHRPWDRIVYLARIWDTVLRGLPNPWLFDKFDVERISSTETLF